MQLWEDYAVGGSWRVLLEKVLLTLVVTASTYYGWLTWSRWQAEAAEFVHVDLPAQLSTAWATTKTEEEQGPKDEVRSRQGLYPDSLTSLLGDRRQDLPSLPSRWPNTAI